MRVFGLIGFPLGHSFSGKYFAEKFQAEAITGCEYRLFPIPVITDLKDSILSTPGLEGLNVTIPYKEQVIPYLDQPDDVVAGIGACNCIHITGNKLFGYNTDVEGFHFSLIEKLQPHHDDALVLGTGGAAKAVIYVLQKLGIGVRVVSRTPTGNQLSYDQLDRETIATHRLVINTTPLGTFPNIEQVPPIPYEYITPDHYLFDLVYNPAETMFLKLGKERGAITKNGSDMLKIQADASWRIWNKNH